MLNIETIKKEWLRSACGDIRSIGNYWERGNQNEIDIVAVD